VPVKSSVWSGFGQEARERGLRALRRPRGHPHTRTCTSSLPSVASPASAAALTATCSAGCPSPSVFSGSAPARSKATTTAGERDRHAACRGVRPLQQAQPGERVTDPSMDASCARLDASLDAFLDAFLDVS
jgi:hypothetical protein